MKKIHLTFLLLFIFVSSVNSQDTTKPFSFPHNTGNMWEYYYYDGPMSIDTFQIFTIFDSTDFNGVIYLEQYARAINPIEPTYFFEDTSIYLVDTVKNYVWILEQTDSSLIYKLDAKKGEQWVQGPGLLGYDIARVKDKWKGVLFGKQTTFMSIVYFSASDSTDTTGYSVGGGDVIADGFGLISTGGGELSGEIHLIGAVIDDTLYGDTTVVSVNDRKGILPSSVKLYPNYPNPFNPSTTISFELPKTSSISLIIYDILGREVYKLIENEEFNSGEHSIKWEGLKEDGSMVTSGIYFYRLIDGTFTSTKKMVVIK